MSPGFENLFEFLENKKDLFECIILSGGISIFIEWSLKYYKINIFQKVISNISNTENGKIELKSYKRHNCNNCQIDICKYNFIIK